MPTLSLSPRRQLPLLPHLFLHGLNPFLPCQVVPVAAWAVLLLGTAPLAWPQFPHCSSQLTLALVLGWGRTWCDGGGWYPPCGPLFPPWHHPGVCGWQGLPWLSHAMAPALKNPPHVMSGSATPFPTVPFPFPVCPGPRHVHCYRMVLGLVATSQPSHWHALPAGTSPGSGELSARTWVPLVLFEGRPQVDTAPSAAGMALSCLGKLPGALLARTVA